MTLKATTKITASTVTGTGLLGLLLVYFLQLPPFEALIVAIAAILALFISAYLGVYAQKNWGIDLTEAVAEAKALIAALFSNGTEK